MRNNTRQNTKSKEPSGARPRARGRGRGGSRRAAPVAAAVAVALLLGACGAGSTRPGGPGSANSPTYQQKVAFSQCMRSHGVPNYPDPGSNGLFPNAGTFNTSTPQFQAAANSCKRLLPNGGQETQAQHQQDVALALRMARCMRSHGVPNYPDPPNGNGQATVTVPRSGGSLSQFQSALRACRSLRPGGGS